MSPSARSLHGLTRYMSLAKPMSFMIMGEMALATSLRRSWLMGGGRVFRMYHQVIYKESPTVNDMIDRSFSLGAWRQKC